jgi:SAM-dependent methyltransferase
MACCNDAADYDWLTGAEAAVLLDELAESCEPLHAMAARLRQQCSQTRTHLVLEQLELRRRAAAKFTDADRMFFTPLGLEQATDQWVAEYKAARFAGRRLVADLCCGIGGDLLALVGQGGVVGVDRSPISTRLAAANVRSVLAVDRARSVTLETRDVDGLSLSDVAAAAWHIDPDRRPEGHRTTSLAWCSPDGACIERLLSKVPHAAVKLAPATVVSDIWQRQCELEWISRDRQCRQLVAWHGSLAERPGMRRATVLSGPTAGDQALAVRSIVGQPRQPMPIIERLDRFVFEPDPAVLAARLTGALAAEHNLSALAAGPTYLTGPQTVADEALASFEVEDVLPLRIRELSRHLRERGVGRLEIKKRGVEVEPEQLRRQLKLRGDRAATLLVTRVAGRPAAIVVHRVSSISGQHVTAVAPPPGQL